MKKIIVVLIVVVTSFIVPACAGNPFTQKPLTYEEATAAEMRIFPTGDKVIRNMDNEGRLDNVEIYFPQNPKYKNGCIMAKLYSGRYGLRPNESIAQVGIANIDPANQNKKWAIEYLFNQQKIVPMEEVMHYLESLDPNTCSWDKQGNGGFKYWCDTEITLSADDFKAWDKSDQ